MQLSVTFKHLDSSESIKSHLAEKVCKLDKLLDNPAEANAVLCVEKFRHIAEISIFGDRLNINAKEETNDIYSAIDVAVDKLEKQLKKSKEKIKKHRAKNKNKWFDKNESLDYEDNFEKEIKVKNIDYKPMYAEEAALQLETAGNSFLVFTSAKTGRVNVIYKRNDGNYGLIQPTI